MVMKMKIEFKNVLVKGEKRCEITKIEGVLGEKELPVQYVSPEDCWCTYINWMGDLHIEAPNGHGFRGTRIRRHRAGSIVSPEEKGWIIRTMKNAGHRLYEINKEIRKLQACWEGNVEVVEI